MNEIRNIPRQGNSFDINDPDPFWQQDKLCGGFIVSDDCNWRWDEMELVTFTPKICLDQTLEGCEYLVAYARVNVAL